MIHCVQFLFIVILSYKGCNLQVEGAKSDLCFDSKCRFVRKHSHDMAFHNKFSKCFIRNRTHRNGVYYYNSGEILKSIRSDDLNRDYEDDKRLLTKTKRISELHSLSQSRYKKKSKINIFKAPTSHQNRRRRSSSSRLSSSVVTRSDTFADKVGKYNSLLENIRSTLEKIEKEDAAIIATYVCTQLAITLPVVLIPVIASDPYAYSMVHSTVNSSAFVGKILSLGSIGLGVGKLLNGFICQALGARVAGISYLLGVGGFALFLSSTSSLHAYAIAGMEFCASMMWTASLVLLSNRYAHDTKKFGNAMMALSLASTSGTMMSKILGGVLLSQCHWRDVTLFSTMFALLGSFLLFTLTKGGESERPNRKNRIVSSLSRSNASSPELFGAGPGFKAIIQSISHVLLKGPIFWYVAFAHFTSFIVRSSDKVLGTCLVDVAHVARK